MNKQYFVVYNGKFIAMYKTAKGALNFIKRKGLKNDSMNSLSVLVKEGREFSQYCDEFPE